MDLLFPDTCKVIPKSEYDPAFMFRDKLMVFAEASSTWSSKLPGRIPLYLTETILEYLRD